MTIKIIKNVDEANQATGLAIIIDVFRAFSTECFVFQNGAKYIIPVLTLEEAYELKRQNPEYVLMGERKGLPPEGFDYGNSPTEILDVDFTDKIVVHTTSNGTKGMMNATKANEIITGSFINAKSIVKYINQNSFEEITLVSTASLSFGENNEDIMLAYYIRDLLERNDIDESKIKFELQNSYVAKFLLQEAKVPSTDIDLCLDFNRFDFIIKQVEISGRKVLVKVEV
jgi:2-phosphosulfolactate phosphatase